MAVNNQKCGECTLFDICKAAAKLKAFTDEARTDLGVELDFVDCVNYHSAEEDCQAEGNPTTEAED